MDEDFREIIKEKDREISELQSKRKRWFYFFWIFLSTKWFPILVSNIRSLFLISDMHWIWLITVPVTCENDYACIIVGTGVKLQRSSLQLCTREDAGGFYCQHRCSYSLTSLSLSLTLIKLSKKKRFWTFSNLVSLSARMTKESGQCHPHFNNDSMDFWSEIFIF